MLALAVVVGVLVFVLVLGAGLVGFEPEQAVSASDSVSAAASAIRIFFMCVIPLELLSTCHR